MACRVPLSDTEAVIQALQRDGGVILTGFTSKEDVEKVNADSAPYIDEMIQERAAKSLPEGTTYCFRLFGRSKTARETWLQQESLQTIMDYFVGTATTRRWGTVEKEYKTKPILSSGATLCIGPGQEAQGLHRDDFIWHQEHVHNDKVEYQIGSDVSIGLLVPGVNTSVANGATKFVPGSHLWGSERIPQDDEALSAEMSIGEAFLFLGSTYHGGGSNNTQNNRRVHAFFYCRSYIRPEENQHLWWTKEEVKQWSLPAQAQAGYVLDGGFVGHCDFKNPIESFRVCEKA